ncbi:MAG: hypothetical protein AAFX44_06175 [Pseudomonadota bacterium]
MKTVLKTAPVALMLVNFLATPAVADSSMGPLNGIIEERASDTWTIRSAPRGGWYFENPGSRWDITYYYVNSPPSDEGKREVTVDVAMLEAEPDSLAGILYGFRDQPRSYYLYTLGGDRSVNLFYFEEGNMERKMQFQLGDMRDGPVQLALREHGSEIALLVNGDEKSRIGNDRMGRGAVGVVTAHVGRFHLENFNVTLAK